MLTRKINDHWFIVRYKNLVFFGTDRKTTEARCKTYMREHSQQAALP